MTKPLSPLRYPGGKTRAVPFLSNLVPEGTKEICSPFFGGGSFELFCASRGIRVTGYDIFDPLVDFWQCIVNNPKKLAREIKNFYPLSKEKFYELQKTQSSYSSKYKRAAIFFVLNRSSFSGSTLSGGMSPKHPRFNAASIDRVTNFKIKDFSVCKSDYEAAIMDNKSALLYLDPPYMISNFLYGKDGNTHKNFNHNKLCEILKNRDGWILSYNDCPEIVNMYSGYKILRPEWKYGMSSNKKSKEIIVLSKDL